jgi:hypothetical protein
MPFQVVELGLDADDQVIDYPQRLDAVETIDKLIARPKKRSITELSAILGLRSLKMGRRGLNSLSKAYSGASSLV